MSADLLTLINHIMYQRSNKQVIQQALDDYAEYTTIYIPPDVARIVVRISRELLRVSIGDYNIFYIGRNRVIMRHSGNEFRCPPPVIEDVGLFNRALQDIGAAERIVTNSDGVPVIRLPDGYGYAMREFNAWYYIGERRSDGTYLNENNDFTCDNCSEACTEVCEMRGDSDLLVCPACQELARCAVCEELREINDTTTTADAGEQWICDSCHDGLDSCAGCGYPLLNDSHNFYCEDCEEDRCSEKLRGYHDGERHSRTTRETRFKVGFEVEKEDYDVLDSADFDYYREQYKVEFEEDGSLDSGGFEMITPILDLGDINGLSDYLSKLSTFINANDSDNCGGHIHVSDTKRTPEKLLDDVTGYLPLLYAMYPDRVSNTYCEAKPSAIYKASSHRAAINLSNYETLEFRLFPTPHSVASLLFRAKLVLYMLKHPRQSSERVYDELLGTGELPRLLGTVYNATRYQEKLALFKQYANKYEGDEILKSEDVANFSNLIGNQKGVPLCVE